LAPGFPKKKASSDSPRAILTSLPLTSRYDIDGKTLKNTARYINHSCDPNCEAVVTKRTIWIVALRDIQAGEELSYNYGLTAKQYRCRCGSKNSTENSPAIFIRGGEPWLMSYCWGFPQ
jgi:uncharacterized protein